MANKNVLELIEQTYAVEQIQLSDGTPVWPLIRQAVYFQTLQQKVQYSNKLRTRNKWQLTKNFFYGIKELFRLKTFSYIFFNNTDKRTNYGGAEFDIYYDAWADIVGQNKSLFIEWAIQKHLPLQNVHSENVISDMPFKFCTAIFSKVSKVKIDGEHILNEILSEYKIKVDYKREIKSKLAEYKTYYMLFKFVRPKAVFVLSSFTKVGVVMAGKKLRIPVYEAQHGYIGNTHPFYHAEKKFPEFYPDTLISFGTSEKDANVPSLIFPSKAIIPVGSLQLDLVKERTPNLKLKTISKSYDLVFCVTLQAIKDKKIVKWVLQQASNNPKWLFIIRPKQPNVSLSLYDTVSNVIELPDISTYDVLNASDYNITIFSTTVVEGIYLDTKPILFNIDNLPRKYFDLDNAEIAIIENDEPINSNHLTKAGSFNTPYFITNYFKNVAKQASCI